MALVTALIGAAAGGRVRLTVTYDRVTLAIAALTLTDDTGIAARAEATYRESATKVVRAATLQAVGSTTVFELPPGLAMAVDEESSRPVFPGHLGMNVPYDGAAR